MFRSKSILLVALLALLVYPGVSFPQTAMKVFVIHSDPLGIVNPDGSSAGIHYDMLKLISKESGVPMDIKVVPKKRIFHELKTGSVDAGIFFPNKEWEPITVNGGTIEEVKLIALGRKGVPINAYENLKSAGKIGLMPEMNVTPQFDNDSALKKEVQKDYETLVKMLQAQRLDVIIGNRVVLLYQLEQLKAGSSVELPGFVFKSIPNQIHIAKSSPFAAKAEVIKAAVEKCKAKKLFDPIYKKYVGDLWKH